MRLRYRDTPRMLPPCLIVLGLSVSWSAFASSCFGQVHDWLLPGVNHDWNTPTAWLPNGVPNAGELARVGNLPIAQGANVLVEADTAVGALQVSNDASVFVNTPASLDVTGDVLVTGAGSDLLIQTLDPFGFAAGGLTVADQAEFRIANGSEIEIADTLIIESTASFTGRGVVGLVNNTGAVLRNDGVIETSAGFGGLVFNQDGDGLLDLDGFTGNGVIVVDDGNSFFGQDAFTVNGTQLQDSFSGVIEMASASILNMNLSQGWTADAGSLISIESRSENSNGIATIEGGHLTLAGQLTVFNGFFSSGAPGHPVDLNAEVSVQPTAAVSIEQGNNLRFNEATVIEGGTFSTPSLLSVDGAIRFNADTTYDGNAVINGIALQNGDATVSGITNVSAGVLDMDGGGGTVWDINNSLTVNAESIDSTLSNTFDGVLQVDSPFSRLTVNLTGAFEKWTMNGELDLSGGPGMLGALRVAGSTMRVTGELNVNGRARISAGVELAGNSDLNFAGADSLLALEGVTIVEAGASFSGGGTIENRPTGHLTLGDGVNLAGSPLVNQGLLEVGDSPGVAIAPEFTATAGATWLVEIGGYAAGAEHDLLLTDSSTLDGLIEVDLIDAGSGLFLPEVGDEFTVLVSFDPLSGAFLNDPVSVANSQEFHWEVIHDPHEVTLRLVEITNVVPEPTALPLFGLGLAAVLGSRRWRA